uniref:Uncharacterized protein n=1 Tax=Anguilla anguilla TaxID=7936 RepID=A0A0E9T4S3_ANGAN
MIQTGGVTLAQTLETSSVSFV